MGGAHEFLNQLRVQVGMEGDGIDLIRSLRSSKRTAPILVMTARAGTEALVEALDGGADDYLVKPFNHHELLARARALLRRHPISQPAFYQAGQVVFDVTAGDVHCDGARLPLRPSERQLLELLIRHIGRTVTRVKIENSLKTVDDDWSPNAIDKLASRLRKVLNVEDTSVKLRTVKGVGYVLEEIP